MYADETYVGSDIGSMQYNLTHDLQNLSKWLYSNNLTPNATKTEFRLIGSRLKLNTLPETLKLSVDTVPVE